MRFSRFVLPILILAVAGFLFFRTGASSGSAARPAAFAENLTMQQAEERSQHSGKPVLVFATADWCGPCQYLKRTALADERVTDAITSRTEPVYLDMTNVRSNPDLAQLSQSLGIPGFPTMLLMSEGEVVSAQIGPVSAEVVLEWLDDQ